MDPSLPPESLPPEPNQFLKSKKLLIALLGGGVLVLFLVGVLLLIRHHNTKSNNSSNSSSTNMPSQVAQPPSTTQTPSSNELQFLQQTAATHEEGDYSIKYPKGWTTFNTIARAANDNNGYYFYITGPSANEKNGYFPRMDIFYTVPKGTDPIQIQANDLMKSDKTQEFWTTFKGYRALKVYGPLHMDIVNSNPHYEADVYKTYYIFLRGNFLYLVDYGYPGTTWNEDYERYFNDILNTLSFK